MGAIGILSSCDSSNGNGPDGSLSFETSPEMDGFMLIRSIGKTVKLGTNSTASTVQERPEMTVEFDYDYSIGKHEVTCSEFNSVMGAAGNDGFAEGDDSTSPLKLDCENDSLPATNLTYYDAALYANAKSRADGMDTAYSYTSASFSSKGNCTNLEGFVFHPEADAYRLPTEAEWILAAGINWKPSEGWNSENSDYKLHKVCSAKNKSDSKSLCDMAGNAMEWVNDWLGNFRDTTITNYVGAPDGGSLGQRILKGGSYRNSPAATNLYSRGDVYTITSATNAAYVGFRLAYGKIPNAIWLNNSGSAVDSRIMALASASTIRTYTKTYRTKLAFRNNVTGNIAYIDYSNGNASVKEIQDTLEAYHPEISPDGKWVAFCTVPEGISKKSALYVRSLSPQGEQLVKLDVESAAIPRWSIAERDTAIIYVTDPGDNEDEAAFKKKSTWQVSFKNGKFGTPQKLFDGAYHGGISKDSKLAVTGSTRLRARTVDASGDISETIWLDSNQACNVSLSKDASKQTLFLDFGSTPGKEFLGKKYAAHEYILIADSVGKLKQMIHAPARFTFDHSEWAVGDTTQNGIVVASLTNTDGAHTKIALVNVKDSSVVELAEGEDLWHPSLWFDGMGGQIDNELLDLDSAGVYLSEGGTINQAQFRIKMERFWKLASTTEILLMGSSRMEVGIKPDLFPERKMFNLAIVGIDPKRDLYFAEHYGLNHLKKLKAIALALDLDGWRGEEDHLSWILAGGPGYTYDANHNFWVDYLPDYFIDAVTASYPASEDVANTFSERGGWQAKTEPNPSMTVQVMNDSVYSEKEMGALEERLNDLADFVKKAAEKDVYVIGILIPQAEQYAETGSYGAYGLQKSVAKKKIEWLKSLSEKNKNFVLMDEYKMGDHDYKGFLFDQDHLSTKGAEKLTTRLDSLLGTLK